MKKFFRFITYITRLIPSGEFAPVTYWRHSENKYLYLCMSKTHIKTDERSTGDEKFLSVFPKAIRISQIEFDSILYFNPDIEIVNVADDNLIHMVAKENEKEIPEGVLLLDEHEESEDKNITNG